MINLYDFDDTLWSRNPDEIEKSIENIKLLNELPDTYIVSGNSYQHIKEKIELALGDINNCNINIIADANTNLYKNNKIISSIKNMSITNYEEIIKKIEKLGYKNKMTILYNINNEPINIKIKPLDNDERDYLYYELNDNINKVVKAGKTTIDILNINNNKINIFNSFNIDRNNCIYFGDEIKYGNDKDIALLCKEYIEIDSIYKMNKILNRGKLIYGLIIAAGNQTRFKTDIPKAIMPINNTTLLDINIKSMSNYTDKIYVVCSYNNKDYFDNYNTIIINSGKGCGDAILKALDYLSDNNDCYIKWGDSLHLDDIYNRMNINNKMVIPVRYEENPYVQIIANENNKIEKILFSKYGENITDGYHDLSLFYANIGYLKYYLKEFANKILDKETNSYIHKHNNELQFLDVFNETEIECYIDILNGINDYSFNTLEEFNKLFNEQTK